MSFEIPTHCASGEAPSFVLSSGTAFAELWSSAGWVQSYITVGKWVPLYNEL